MCARWQGVALCSLYHQAPLENDVSSPRPPPYPRGLCLLPPTQFAKTLICHMCGQAAWAPANVCVSLLPSPAIAMLKDKEPGSFIVRDSHSFRGAYGLAMKVATPPPSVLQLNKKGRDPGADGARSPAWEVCGLCIRLCVAGGLYGHGSEFLCSLCVVPVWPPQDWPCASNIVNDLWSLVLYCCE